LSFKVFELSLIISTVDSNVPTLPLNVVNDASNCTVLVFELV
jgi:hypothetical protein